MNTKALIIFLVLVLVACDSKNKIITDAVIYNADVSEAVGLFENEYARKRTEVDFKNGVKANDCKSYFKAGKVSGIGEGVNNQIIKSEYLMCDVLHLIENAKYIMIKEKPEFGKILAQQVDLRSFPSSYFQKLDEKNHTLAKLPGKLNINPASASIESEDWYYGLELVAVTDVDKNTKADWIIWLVDEAKIGNYRGYQTLVAYDVDKNDGLIRLQPFPTFPNFE